MGGPHCVYPSSVDTRWGCLGDICIPVFLNFNAAPGTRHVMCVRRARRARCISMPCVSCTSWVSGGGRQNEACSRHLTAELSPLWTALPVGILPVHYVKPIPPGLRHGCRTTELWSLLAMLVPARGQCCGLNVYVPQIYTLTPSLQCG